MDTVKLFWFILMFWSAHWMPLGAFLFEQVQIIKKNIILIEKHLLHYDLMVFQLLLVDSTTNTCN